MNNEQPIHSPYQSYFIMTYKQATLAHAKRIYHPMMLFPSARRG